MFNEKNYIISVVSGLNDIDMKKLERLYQRKNNQKKNGDLTTKYFINMIVEIRKSILKYSHI